MKIFFLIILFPLRLFSQVTADKDITGLWKGYISTDEKKLPYEMVITTHNDTLSGFAYTTFNVNGKEIVSMKKISVRWHKQEIIVEDNDNVYNNFPDDAPTKIKQINTLSLSDKADNLRLTGSFETKAPKQFRRAKGVVFLEKKESPEDAKLMAKLDELKLTNSLSFSFKDKKNIQADTIGIVTVSKVIITSIQPPANPPAAPEIKDSIVLLTSYSFSKLESLQLLPSRNQVNKLLIPKAVTFHKRMKELPVREQEKTTIAVVTLPPTKPVIASAKPVVINKPIVAAKKTIVSASTPPIAIVNTTLVKPTPVNIAVAPAIDLAKRKIEIIDQLYIEADSLQFTLYDNGEVDGDTVSIIMNGKTIVSHQGLNTSAFTKTIYLTPDLGDTIQLVMYAETLGSIPPNTGLLILNYDKLRKEIRFSGDLNKNAAITLRRKRINN